MINKNVTKSSEDAIAYEDARKNKNKGELPTPVSDKDVEGINKRLSPDENSMESRG